MDNIQDKFFSKNNISLLNNKLLENLKLKNANEKQRIYIAQTLVNIMKNIWKTLDLSKIRPDNFQSVLTQFNNIVYKNAFEEINKSISMNQQHDKKYDRDFNSLPNNSVKIQERPKSINESNNIHKFTDPWAQKSLEMNEMMNPHVNLDNLFRPIVDNLPEEARFNNYTIGKGGDSKERLQDIQRMRDMEVPLQKHSQNEMPDFLKPRATSVRMHEDNNSNAKSYNSNDRSYNSNAKSYNSNQNNELNFIDGLDDNENLYGLDNINKSLINDEYYEEDQSCFSDRLNKLKNERENIKIPKQRSIDFKSDNYNDDYNDNNDDNFDDIQPTRIDKLKQINEHHNEYNNEYNKHNNEYNKHNKYNKYNKHNKHNKYNNDHNNEYNKHHKSNKLSNEQLEIFNKLKILNKNLMEQLKICKEENKKLLNDNLEIAEKLEEVINKI